MRCSLWTLSCRLISVACAVALLAACGPTTIDTSSFEGLERSVTDLREPMEEGQRAQFDESLNYLVGETALLNGEKQPAHPELVLALYKPLAGMTAEGIISEALRRRLDEVQTAVAAIERKREGAEEQRLALDAFDLQKSKVYKRNRGSLEWPVIEFKAANNTDQLIWLIHFRAALMRPGYDEPWLVEEFDQLVLNGIAPGERDLWRIEPERQEWVTLVDPHPDLLFTLEVMRLEGLGGNVIAATEWGFIEEIQIEMYEKTLEIIREGNSLALDQPPRPGVPQ